MAKNKVAPFFRTRCIILSAKRTDLEISETFMNVLIICDPVVLHRYISVYAGFSNRAV